MLTPILNYDPTRLVMSTSPSDTPARLEQGRPAPRRANGPLKCPPAAPQGAAYKHGAFWVARARGATGRALAAAATLGVRVDDFAVASSWCFKLMLVAFQVGAAPATGRLGLETRTMPVPESHGRKAEPSGPAPLPAPAGPRGYLRGHGTVNLSL